MLSASHLLWFRRFCTLSLDFCPPLYSPIVLSFLPSLFAHAAHKSIVPSMNCPSLCKEIWFWVNAAKSLSLYDIKVLIIKPSNGLNYYMS